MTPVQPDENSESGWPRQTFRRLLLSSIVLGVVVYVTLINHGAPLEAPADPNSEGYPARPEWYFVWLSQLLKLCHGGNEWIATVAVPTGILGFLCLMPLLGHVLPKKLAHFVSCVFVLCLVGGVSYLTYLGYERDAKDPLFAKGKQKAEEAKERAFQLAALGISPEGSSSILRTDPLYHGGQVFEKKCASCHYFNGKGLEHTPQSAPDLHDFASKAWIRGLLENPRADRYFGKAAGHTGMARWKKGSKLTSKQLDDVADFVFQLTQIPDDMEPEEWLEQPKVSGHPGMEAFTNECGKCHKVRELTEGGDEAPDLYAWGSMRWTTRMINNPNAHGFYKYLEDKQKMPAFAEQTTPNDVATVIRYIKGDYHKPGEEAKAVATPSPAPSLSH